jgi:hypothetical protein
MRRALVFLEVLSILMLLPLACFAEDSLNCSDCLVSQSSKGSSPPFDLKECELLQRNKLGNADPAGLSLYWGQEYTGADLARQVLRRLGIHSDGIGIQNLDVTPQDGDHGTLASHLIAGSTPMSLIPAEKSPVVSRFGDVAFGKKKYSDLDSSKTKIITTSVYPSKNWQDGIQCLQDYFCAASEKKSVIVAASGNQGGLVEPTYSPLAQAGVMTLIGSMASDGSPASYSNYGSEISILAPSGVEGIFSRGLAMPTQFVGTSASAPQVAAALHAFELVTQAKIDLKQAKLLLENTALKTRSSLIQPRRHGAGLLNTYKITKVAEKIAEKCKTYPDKTKCAAAALEQRDTYKFRRKDTGTAESIFSDCFGRSRPRITPKCEEKKAALNFLRSEALLHGEGRLWQGISCIHSSVDLFKNAVFYQELARVSGMSAADACRDTDSPEELLRQVRSQCKSKKKLRQLWSLVGLEQLRLNSASIISYLNQFQENELNTKELSFLKYTASNRIFAQDELVFACFLNQSCQSSLVLSLAEEQLMRGWTLPEIVALNREMDPSIPFQKRLCRVLLKKVKMEKKSGFESDELFSSVLFCSTFEE